MGSKTKTTPLPLPAFISRALPPHQRTFYRIAFSCLWVILCSFGLLGLLSPSAWAINLGHTQIDSKQGEPLQARIEIHSATPEELQGLKVRLYGQKDYQALNLSWEKSLANTTLQLAQGKDSRLFVQIEGQEPVEQSFVELFFELSWNSGQINRQVGLLLDPSKTPTSMPTLEEPMGPKVMVHAGDTASQLIKPYVSEDVSLDQMLLALVNENPKAFVNANANRLLAGAQLSIPNRDLAKSVSSNEARSAVQSQNVDFNAYRQSLVEKIKASKSEAVKDRQQSSSGKVHDPRHNPPSARDQLKLTPPKGSKSANNAQQLEQITKDREALEQAQKLKELQENLKELEAVKQSGQGFAPLLIWNAMVQGVSDQWNEAKTWSYLKLPALKTYAQWNLAPVVSGMLFAVFVLMVLWRIQSRKHLSAANEGSEVQHSPDFHVWQDPVLVHGQAPSFDEDTKMALKNDQLQPYPESPLYPQNGVEQQIHAHAASPSVDPSLEDDRVKLAEDLWEIGQHHTAYAIAQEVYQQSSGREFERAKVWLQSHAI